MREAEGITHIQNETGCNSVADEFSAETRGEPRLIVGSPLEGW